MSKQISYMLIRAHLTMHLKLVTTMCVSLNGVSVLCLMCTHDD